MKAECVIHSAAQMLVSAQVDCLKGSLDGCNLFWADGFYSGKRAAARYILKNASKDTRGKSVVKKSLRIWCKYFHERFEELKGGAS